VITDYLRNWHTLQRETFPTIAGMLLLDDIVGFMGEADFVEFARPYLRELYDVNVPVKFFHNDAPCAESIRHYPDIGINLYNPGTQTSLTEMRRLCGNRLTILGNIPPRDVLAQGGPVDVCRAVERLLTEAQDPSRLIVSCGGGVPPGVSSQNLRALVDATRAAS
jgi:uroporphyrinogen decarboxylase